MFGGVGLAALPMDLITAFTARPKPMTAEQLAHEQLLLQARVGDLVEVNGIGFGCVGVDVHCVWFWIVRGVCVWVVWYASPYP